MNKLILLVGSAFLLLLLTDQTQGACTARREQKAIEDAQVVIADAPTAEQLAQDLAAEAVAEKDSRSADAVSSASFCDNAVKRK